MKKSTVFVAVTTAALVATCLMAQEPASVDKTLLDEATRMNQTLAQIASLLQKHVEAQDTDLLIKRFELSGRSLIPQKERLRKARESVADLDAEEADLAGVLEAQEEELASEGLDAESEPYHKLQVSQMERRVEAIQERRQTLAREIMELENEVAAREEDLAILRDAIDSRLGLR